MSFFEVVFGFALGMAAHRIFWSFIGLGKIGIYMKDAEYHSLMMLVSVAESISYITQIKHNMMIDLKFPDSEVKLTKNMDEHNFKKWKETAIHSLKSAYPVEFRYISSYEDWESALVFLDKIYKKRNK